jgi:hypothetical protein
MAYPTSYFLGIDPGKSGAWALIKDIGEVAATGLYDERHSLMSMEYAEILSHIQLACLEKVSAMPGQGVTSMFTFGETFGLWQGILEALHIPFELVTPARWQKSILDFLPAKVGKAAGEDHKRAVERRLENRRVLKAATTTYVIRRYPELTYKLTVKKNQGIADAVCIALYARLRTISNKCPTEETL